VKKTWFQKNRKRWNELQREWRQKNPKKFASYVRKYREKRNKRAEEIFWQAHRERMTKLKNKI